ncbi:MAG: TetR family transcriptional regulator [Rhodospirillales bacterium]
MTEAEAQQGRAAAETTAEKLIAAALALAEERGWRAVSLADVAKRAAVPLSDCYRLIPDKAALLCRLLAATDEHMLRHGAADPHDNTRDRLFDVMMRRFDALQSRRQGMIAILRDLPFDPGSALRLLPRLRRSVVWMLEAAGISTAGLRGAVRVRVLGGVYLCGLRAWIDDETADMARTMATLDKALRRVERLADMLPRRAGRRDQDEPVAA